MAHRKLSPDQLQEIRDLASRWGKIVARHAFGEAGPGTDVDLDAMEQVAAAAAAGLTEGTLATLVEQQAQVLGTEQPCPDCGRPCAVQRRTRPGRRAKRFASPERSRRRGQKGCRCC